MDITLRDRHLKEDIQSIILPAMEHDELVQYGRYLLH